MIISDKNIFDRDFDGYWRVILCTLSRRWSGQFQIMSSFWQENPLAWRWWKERLEQNKYYITIWQIRKIIMFPCAIIYNHLFDLSQIEKDLYELNSLSLRTNICFPAGILMFEIISEFLDDRFIYCNMTDIVSEKI